MSCAYDLNVHFLSFLTYLADSVSEIYMLAQSALLRNNDETLLPEKLQHSVLFCHRIPS